MKMSTLPLLLVAMVALTRAAVILDAEAENKEMEKEDAGAGKHPETEELDIFKRTFLSCPRGWRPYGGRCFHFVPRQMNWFDARKNCWSMGGNLASVHNAEEYHWIQRLIADRVHAHPITWLGGHDLVHEGHWKWDDGTSFWFSYWCRGEPNGARRQNCLTMNDSGNKCWDDYYCSQHRASLCVRKPW